jgi:hypothetical protein
VTTQGLVTIEFRIGFITLIRSINIATLVSTIKFHIVISNTLFLFCLDNIDRLGVYLKNTKNLLILPYYKVLVTRRFSYMFLL